jgi:hypothetical protein
MPQLLGKAFEQIGDRPVHASPVLAPGQHAGKALRHSLLFVGQVGARLLQHGQQCCLDLLILEEVFVGGHGRHQVFVFRFIFRDETLGSAFQPCLEGLIEGGVRAQFLDLGGEFVAGKLLGLIEEETY